MKRVIAAVLFLLMAVGTADAEWINFYKNRSDGALYYYNKDKLKNGGAVTTVWMKIDDGYPGKLDVDCKKNTYKSITKAVNEIAPDSMMEALATIICKNKPEGEK